MRKELILTGKDCIRAVLYHCTVENLDSPQSLPKKQKQREHFLTHNSFHEISIILIPKPDKVITRKESYRLISLMNINTNTLQKML